MQVYYKYVKITLEKLRGDFMKAVGVVVEYNPFHNGHLYHLNQAKKLYPNHIVIAVMSSHFTQRGHPAIINKWARTKLALSLGVDIVCELPYAFTCEHANIFAKGSVRTLANLKIDKLVFGSESNDISRLINLAKIQLDHPDYQSIVKSLMNQGLNYATACSKALEEIEGQEINVPNDILGLAYIKEILESKLKIDPISIKRTNDYHSVELDNKIASATAVRLGLFENNDVKEFVPEETYNALNNNSLHFMNDYFDLLKYKILTSSKEELANIHSVDEGLENRILKLINDSSTIDEFIKAIKTKRYTYNRINRMLIHILVNYTKDDRAKVNDIGYTRILGLNQKGRDYLKSIRKDVEHPVISKISESDSKLLVLEQKVTNVYNLTSREGLDILEYKNFSLFEE